MRTRLILGLVLALAAVLTFFKVPLASSQGVILVAEYVPPEVNLDDPDSLYWLRASAVEVPLSAQIVTRPTLLDARIRSLTARALHNGSRIAILLEWADETQDDSMVRVQDFRDAVALQFSLSDVQPFFCMGQQNGNVNIWFWRADWQADITARQDMETLYPHMYVDYYPFADPEAGLAAGPGSYLDRSYLPALAAGNLFASAERTSPVENMVAGGFGALKAQPPAAQNVQGYGAWAEGKWRVVFSRDLVSGKAGDVSFRPRGMYSIAFAAWDGANNERNGQKSTSQWLALQLREVPPTPLAPGEVEAAPRPYDPSGVLAVVVLPLALISLFFLGLVGLVAVLVSLAQGQKKEE